MTNTRKLCRSSHSTFKNDLTKINRRPFEMCTFKKWKPSGWYRTPEAISVLHGQCCFLDHTFFKQTSQVGQMEQCLEGRLRQHINNKGCDCYSLFFASASRTPRLLVSALYRMLKNKMMMLILGPRGVSSVISLERSTSVKPSQR